MQAEQVFRRRMGEGAAAGRARGARQIVHQRREADVPAEDFPLSSHPETAGQVLFDDVKQGRNAHAGCDAWPGWQTWWQRHLHNCNKDGIECGEALITHPIFATPSQVSSTLDPLRSLQAGDVMKMAGGEISSTHGRAATCPAARSPSVALEELQEQEALLLLLPMCMYARPECRPRLYGSTTQKCHTAASEACTHESLQMQMTRLCTTPRACRKRSPRETSRATSRPRLCQRSCRSESSSSARRRSPPWSDSNASHLLWTESRHAVRLMLWACRHHIVAVQAPDCPSTGLHWHVTIAVILIWIAVKHAVIPAKRACMYSRTSIAWSESSRQAP